MTDTQEPPFWKRIGLREWMTLVVFVFGMGSWVQTLRHDAGDLQRQIIELRLRADMQDQLIRDTYARRDMVDEKLNAILFRVQNVETYMKKLTQ